MPKIMILKFFVFTKEFASYYGETCILLWRKPKDNSNLSEKLVNHIFNPKTDWSVLKRFLNNKNIPCIPSIFHENKFVTYFRKKAEISNSLFSETIR